MFFVGGFDWRGREGGVEGRVEERVGEDKENTTCIELLGKRRLGVAFPASYGEIHPCQKI